ncbi:related to n-terminal acetyltransferase 1 [Pseudozyma flocculosa]|uniref:Related to n-terminal acetyltransferase 1 n=1 Tax=Pseudozyma flocculosa TaxID=84751 RepID=A0A5C3F9C1_9BASI|nr:related to n-terminal acetyltransferase 1 [Pseudozyma flocculosa]
MPPKKSALPTKERTLFTRLISEYEHKKHKLGIKTADTILKKFPEHGETLAMKGLILGSLNRRDEGIELAKKGVRHDLTSFICWHALGILHRMDKNYQEAIKCYSQALRIEGANLNLLRESAFMHLQLRNYPPLIDARLTILRMQPHLRMNWVGLAVAHHLAGSLDQAERVLASYENVMRDVPDRNYEHSEVLLYHASILEEKRDFQRAAELLDANARQIVDQRARVEALARCYQHTGRKDEAEAIWRDLIAKNSENQRYFAGLLSARGIDIVQTSDEMRAQALALLAELQQAHPKSTAAKRLSLVFAVGDDFAAQATAYARAALIKGVPSLFSDLKSLYRNPAKQQALEAAVEGLRLEWAPKAGETESDPPSSYLWSLYYLAQHYSFIGQAQRALAYIDSAIAHSATLPELHMVRARVLKRGGDLEAAADAMVDARLLDGQDRFLNSKAAKYLLRKGDVDEAVKTVGLFTKADAPDPVFDLNEMQALWYLSEEADAHLRNRDLGMALKRLHQVDRTFQEIYDDQLDFHSYCLRKMTMRSYVDTVRFEDNLRSHPAYFRSALAAVDLYVGLHDDPSLQDPSKAAAAGGAGANGSDAAGGANGMTDEERKKAAKKAKKAEMKAAEEAARRKAADEAAAAKKKKSGASSDKDAKRDDDELPAVPEDKDPRGEQLLRTATPLVEAARFVQTLQERAPRRVETWLATFEVAIRQPGTHLLLAARALTHAHKLEPEHPELVEKLIRFKQVLASSGAQQQQHRNVIDRALGSIVPADKPCEAIYTEFLQRHSDQGRYLLGAAKAVVALRGREEGKEEAKNLVLSLVRSEVKSDLATLLRARTFLTTALSLGPGAEDLERFDAEAQHKFPLASTFKSAVAVEEERKRRADAHWH